MTTEEIITTTFRIDLKKHQFDFFEKLIAEMENLILNDKTDFSETTLNEMKQILNSHKEIIWSPNKANAAAKATALRIKRAKEKIQNAINILRMKNKKITIYSVSKTANISFNTVKKYSDMINSFNEVK